MDGRKTLGILYFVMNPDRGSVMSTTPRSDKPSQPTMPESESPPAGRTVFYRPSFGITVQRNTLCVSVSAKPDTSANCAPACG